MEGCKKEAIKINIKLLQITLANIQTIIPESNAIYVVGIDGRKTTYLGSYMSTKKRREKNK